MTEALHRGPFPAAPAWRLLDDIDRGLDGEAQMTADLALLHEVADGAPPALRLYTWSRPTLSIGRLQDRRDVDVDGCARFDVPVVRRPSGGAALLHGGDLTYAVAMPIPPGSAGAVQRVYDLVAACLILGLQQLGVRAAVARHDGPVGAVCFAGQQGADLRVGDRKLCGSAQARQRGAVLQHGSILLQRLPFDESDLTIGPCDRATLRRVTVTLEELGAPVDPRRVAAAMTTGFTTRVGHRSAAPAVPAHRASTSR